MSRPSLSVVFPVAGLGTILLALTAATGKLRWLAEHLPLTPTPNGFAALLLTLIAGGTWWKLHQTDTPAHPQLELPDELPTRANEKWPDGAEPLAGATWPDPGGELFGTFPFTEAVQPRRLHPEITAEDLDPDPEQLNPTLLPVRPERRVRS